MKVSSFFQGSALRFSVTGDGVSFDSATGDLTVDTEALAAGITVTITALDAEGGAGQSFQLTVAAATDAEETAAPSLVTPPILTGTGRPGAVLEVDPGVWEGIPAPTLALQWLREGVEIPGASGTSYLAGDEDDGLGITCRITARNSAGVVTAEPEQVRITRTPPRAVDLLGDVTAFEGSEAVQLDAAAVFSGESLRFAVTGAGATIDAVTGLLTIPTDNVQDGTLVTVTASNSGGTAEAALVVSILLRPFPPLLLTVPILAGSGKVGSTVTVDAGIWSGLPAPTLALQWLRDGAEIPGATGPAYEPGDADDRAALACRVSALNAAGALGAETAPLVVTQEAPVLVGELLDEVLDLGEGTETIATAQIFQGRGLSFGAAGAGAAIDPATGVLSLPTGAVRSAEEVIVTATNSGGAVSTGFLVTVEDPAGLYPPAIAETLWSAVEVRDTAPAGRRRISVDAAVVVPSGFELRLYSGPQAGGAIAATNRVMTPGETFTTSGSLPLGTTCTTLLYWRRTADDSWVPASGEIVFPIAGLQTTPQPDPGFPAADQTLTAATGAALLAALKARVATASTADWVIHLPAGDYGAVDLSDLKLPGKTTLRSANWPATGARFRQLTMERCQNLHLEFCLFDRSDLPRNDTLSVINLRGASWCGISYSELNLGPNVVSGIGWLHHVNYGIDIWNDKATQTLPHHITIHMNYIHGAAGWGVYLGGGQYLTISENVFADISSDDIQLGWVRDSLFKNNWGARKKYPYYSNNDYDHCDFIQTFSKSLDTPGNQYVGNVYMKGAYNVGAPAQGLFGNGSHISNHLFENNIILTNTPNALMYAGSTQAYGNRCRFNTVLRLVDDTTFSSFHTAMIRMPGAVEISRNVHCSTAGDNSMGLDGLNIVMRTGNYAASLGYYTSPRTTASFYDLRPVEGKVTHWAYNGDRQGAFQRFQDVIAGGKYPKVGPAAAAWKTWYDPQNQITA